MPERGNPCLTCGVCCTMFRVSFYWAEADDAKPGGVPVELTDKISPHRLAMKGTGGSAPRCVALQGPLCESVRCSIHTQRPTPCRDFEASWANGKAHDRCDAARARFGLPPLTPRDWEPIPHDFDDDRRLPPIAA